MTTYPVQLYYARRPFSNDPEIITHNELIHLARKQSSYEIDSIESAMISLKRNHVYASIETITLTLTNEDFIGTLKPDGTIAGPLNVKPFDTVIPEDSYILKNFTSFSDTVRKNIAIFLNNMRESLPDRKNEKTTAQTAYHDLQARIIEDFTRTHFLVESEGEAQEQIAYMIHPNVVDQAAFNKILHNTLRNLTMTEFLSDDDEIFYEIVDRFTNNVFN